jgi:hypothetical protein
MVQLTNRSLFGFKVQTKKPSRWFWGPNHQTVAAGFKAQTGKPEVTGFEAKLRETVNLGFEAQPINPCSSSRYVWCRSHTASHDLLIIRPLSTRPVLGHPWSSAPGFLLLLCSSSLPAMSHLSPIHHETNKHDSPHKIDNKVRTTETSWF